MKKYKTLFLVVGLSLALVTNVIGQSSVASTSTWYSTFFDQIVASFTGDDSDCILKICTACKPGDDCRPED